jgi:hypothetical protein
MSLILEHHLGGKVCNFTLQRGAIPHCLGTSVAALQQAAAK